MQVQQKIRKICEKIEINFKLETLKLIDPESIEVNPVVDSVLGTIHLRRRHVLGGEGSKIGQIC